MGSNNRIEHFKSLQMLKNVTVDGTPLIPKKSNAPLP